MNNISIVSACKNREQNLLKVIDSWLNTDCSEIALVDWSCDTPLAQTLSENSINDSRIRIFRVNDEPRWILTHAYNVGLKRCHGDYILKLDNDHRITDNFFTHNNLSKEHDARLGSWRLAEDESQAYINGAFFISRKALADIGYFNEVITTYGWDDGYLYESLFSNGARIAHIDPKTIEHIEQEEATRTAQQSVSLEQELASAVGRKVTEFMNRRNMYLTALLPRQDKNAEHTSYKEVDTSIKHGFEVTTLIRISDPSQLIDSQYNDLATLLAFRDFHAWATGQKPSQIKLADLHTLNPSLSTSVKDLPKPNQAGGAAGGSAQKPALNTISLKPKPSSIQLPDRIVKQLWKLVPLACSKYGHTTNELSYVISLKGLALKPGDEETLNGLIPEWARSKVQFTFKPRQEESVQTVQPLMSFEPLASKLLFHREDNQYFWAVYNSLKPEIKRCLLDLIENGGKPYDVITQTVASDLASGRIDGGEAVLRLSPIALIHPSSQQAEFDKWIKGKTISIEKYHGKDIASIVSDGLKRGKQQANSKPLTLVTALFKGSQHLVEFCLHLRRMHLFKRITFKIYIAPSDQSDHQKRFLLSFFKSIPNVEVYPLEEDPGLYDCWNMGCRTADTIYCGNTNVDDRRGRYHADYLIYHSERLQLDATASALLTDTTTSAATYSPTQDAWFTGMGRSISKQDLYVSNEKTFTSQNLLHCLPIWRRKLHEKIGYFDEQSFGTSADWEFWLRACEKEAKLDLLDLPLGFYLVDQKSHNRRNLEERIRLEKNIANKYIRENIGGLAMEVT